MNAFHLAGCGGHLNIVKYLVAKFSERIYDLDNMGNTSLHWAAKEGHLNVVKYLVEECGFYAGLGNMVSPSLYALQSIYSLTTALLGVMLQCTSNLC